MLCSSRPHLMRSHPNALAFALAFERVHPWASSTDVHRSVCTSQCLSWLFPPLNDALRPLFCLHSCAPGDHECCSVVWCVHSHFSQDLGKSRFLASRPPAHSGVFSLLPRYSCPQPLVQASP